MNWRIVGATYESPPAIALGEMNPGARSFADQRLHE